MNKKEKDKKESEISRGTGFVSLGRISLLAKEKHFKPHLQEIFDLIEAEIVVPPNLSKEQYNNYNRPISNSDVLLCIKDLAKNYGYEIEERFCSPRGQNLQP